MAKNKAYFKNSMRRAWHGYLHDVFPIGENDLIAAPSAVCGMAGGISAAYLCVLAIAASPLAALGALAGAGICGAALGATLMKDRLGGPVEGFFRGVLTPVYAATGAGLFVGGAAAFCIYSAFSMPLHLASGLARAPLDWALDKTGLAKFLPEKKSKFYRPPPTPVSDFMTGVLYDLASLTKAFNGGRDILAAPAEKPALDRAPKR